MAPSSTTARKPGRRRRGDAGDPTDAALLDLLQVIDIDELAVRLLRHLVSLAGADGGRLYLRDPRRGRWRPQAGQGLDPGGRALPLGPLRPLLARQRRDPGPDPRDGRIPAPWRRRGVFHLAWIPISGPVGPVGLAAIWRRGRRRLAAAALGRAAHLAGRIGPGLENAWTVQGYRELVIKDDQTDCYNRRHFEPVLTEEMERALRYGTRLGLIFLDLDNLKQVNNRFGHWVGSRVLRELCHRLIGSIRKFDKVFRFGGDEFCILLPHTHLRGSKELAERLRRAVSGQPFMIRETGGIALTASFGIAAFPQHARTGPELVQRADQAMQRIKESGKNSIGVVDGPVSSAAARTRGGGRPAGRR